MTTNVGVETRESPVGPITVAVGPRGVLAIELGGADPRELARRLEPALGSVRLGRRGAGDVHRQLSEYFRGRRRKFEVAVDLSLVDGFRRRVLRALCRVPYGRVVTYGELARRVGNPAAARAIGGAVGANPVSIVVPCHRVVAAGGRLGGFSAGLGRKRVLHAVEGIELAG